MRLGCGPTGALANIHHPATCCLSPNFHSKDFYGSARKRGYLLRVGSIDGKQIINWSDPLFLCQEVQFSQLCGATSKQNGEPPHNRRRYVVVGGRLTPPNPSSRSFRTRENICVANLHTIDNPMPKGIWIIIRCWGFFFVEYCGCGGMNWSTTTSQSIKKMRKEEKNVLEGGSCWTLTALLLFWLGLRTSRGCYDGGICGITSSLIPSRNVGIVDD